MSQTADQQRIALRQHVYAAAKLAHELGWDLSKFQDVTCAYFLTEENEHAEVATQELSQPTQSNGGSDDSRRPDQGRAGADGHVETKSVHRARFPSLGTGAHAADEKHERADSKQATTHPANTIIQCDFCPRPAGMQIGDTAVCTMCFRRRFL